RWSVFGAHLFVKRVELSTGLAPSHEPAIGARTAMSARIKSEALADKAVRAPVRRWFMVPMRDSEIVEALHEPYSQVIGNEQNNRDRFMASIHVRILEESPAHEPPSPLLRRGESGSTTGRGGSIIIDAHLIAPKAADSVHNRATHITPDGFASG